MKFIWFLVIVLLVAAFIGGQRGESAAPVTVGTDVAFIGGLIVFLVIGVSCVYIFTAGIKRRPYKPERGLNGEVYSYKVLDYDWHTGEYSSPRGDRWKGGKLKADKHPNSSNAHGIYGVSRLDDEEITHFQGAVHNPRRVKIKHDGIIQVHEYGVRSSEAEIVEDYDR